MASISSQNRRFSTREMIDELLSERQEVLVLYCKLAGIDPYSHQKPIQDELRDFCEVLIDYTALTHFEIYERIVEGKERRQNVIETAEEVHSRITELTSDIVAFNDKYDESDHALILNHLEEDLSRLGVILAKRIELEDRIIRALQE
ncbi:MAG: sigma D regulator [Gammaproteobacteria bacterium]|nr:sigma D regulator [Gammaproteobacteria bacterium]MBU1653890.1 sigma D regulator [Gammaproteobacteria bacterium]MBU1962602.1 sigma D regulator [Gammaproteobacteria bacterium]